MSWDDFQCLICYTKHNEQNCPTCGNKNETRPMDVIGDLTAKLAALKSGSYTDALIDLAVNAYREAASAKDEEIHAPCASWPEGFYTKEDHDIIAFHAMRAALAAVFQQLMKP